MIPFLLILASCVAYLLPVSVATSASVSERLQGMRLAQSGRMPQDPLHQLYGSGGYNSLTRSHGNGAHYPPMSNRHLYDPAAAAARQQQQYYGPSAAAAARQQQGIRDHQQRRTSRGPAALTLSDLQVGQRRSRGVSSRTASREREKTASIRGFHPTPVVVTERDVEPPTAGRGTPHVVSGRHTGSLVAAARRDGRHVGVEGQRVRTRTESPGERAGTSRTEWSSGGRKVPATQESRTSGGPRGQEEKEEGLEVAGEARTSIMPSSSGPPGSADQRTSTSETTAEEMARPLRFRSGKGKVRDVLFPEVVEGDKGDKRPPPSKRKSWSSPWTTFFGHCCGKNVQAHDDVEEAEDVSVIPSTL